MYGPGSETSFHAHRGVDMKISLVIDDALVEEAFRHSVAKTTQGLVDEALRELIRARGRQSLRDLKGRIRFARGYDYKKFRTARGLSSEGSRPRKSRSR